jgi:positive regulator of sigma E activity
MSLLSLVNAGNLAFLSALVVVFSIKNIFGKVAIIDAVSILIKFRAGFDIENFVFLFALMLGAILEEKLPFKKPVNAIVSLVASFIALNAYLYLS